MIPDGDKSDTMVRNSLIVLGLIVTGCDISERFDARASIEDRIRTIAQ